MLSNVMCSPNAVILTSGTLVIGLAETHNRHSAQHQYYPPRQGINEIMNVKE